VGWDDETTDLGTKRPAGRHDDQRYVIPDCEGKVQVGVRGYGVVDSAKGRQRGGGEPGKQLTSPP